ncbi:hypothetical protein [Octadecabacter ascidiaceicola]|nr:hypothetical protein [Octadecabacter ascidiaceicola]
MDRSPFTEFDNIAIVADASMTAEFSGTGTFTGSITNFEAVTSAGTDTQTLVPASGEILIGQDESLIGTGTLNNALAADYAGGFTVDGTSYTVDGVIIGQFIGNRTSDPTPAGITKGVVGGNTTLSTQYAVTDTGALTAFELTVFGETVR